MRARRDVAELERRGALGRTHSGAVLPSPSSKKDSFARRLETAKAEKEALAQAAVATIAENDSVFLDSSMTSWYVARRIAETQLGVTS